MTHIKAPDSHQHVEIYTCRGQNRSDYLKIYTYTVIIVESKCTLSMIGHFVDLQVLKVAKLSPYYFPQRQVEGIRELRNKICTFGRYAFMPKDL